jgi:uncharacterized membrane protein
MDPIVADWLGLALRWVHVMVGIIWFGTSFYFIWLDSALRREEGQPVGILGRRGWSTAAVSPCDQVYRRSEIACRANSTGFKYESYFTWISGFRLVVIYYWRRPSADRSADTGTDADDGNPRQRRRAGRGMDRL